ncbi:MAG TPA: hypothetical protein VMF67_11715 [Rhizomicrobium sp.]|nr:hypothetical protein [Rhizomicrobium sp.]
MLRMNRRNLLATSAAAALCTSSGICAMVRRGSILPGAKIAARHAGKPFITNITLYNLDQRRHHTAPSISYGHAFADGDIPAGGSVTMADSKGNPVVVQMDAVALWPSGCPRFVVLSHACAETFGPGANKTYSIGSSSTPPNNNPGSAWGNSPEATMAANTNFTVEYSGFDAGTSTYTVSLNSIFSNYTSFPWGTKHPQGGWERTKVGPVCMEWHAWQYLINDSTGVPQGYVRCDMWIKAWSPTGPFEIDVRTSQPNMWNAISKNSQGYNVSPGRWATFCTISNGSAVIQYAGGPDDYRATTIPNSDFNTSNNTITATAFSLFPQQGIVFASSGALPTGISANTIYWLAYLNCSANPYICTQRTFVSTLEQNAQPAWQPNTSYSQYSCVQNGNMFYICVQAGTSGSSGGPTGTGDAIVDGTCEWQNMNIPFTDHGTGTVTAYPVNACFPSTAWLTGDRHGNPLWNGPGKRPPIFPGHDFTYLTNHTKYLPPYNINAGYQTTNQSLNVYAPNQNYGGILWYQGTTGDGPGDERIGYVDNWGVTALMNPSDPFYVYSSIQAALCYNQALFSYMMDERGGMPFCANDGPDKNGTAYQNLPGVIPSWAANNTPGNQPAFGVGNWLPWSSAFQDQSGYGGQWYVDSSHAPAPWQVPYLKTGRGCFLDQATHQGNASCFMQYANNAVFGSTTYYCVIELGGLQERAWAWGLRTLCQALYVAPAANAFQPVLADYYDDNAAAQAVYYTSYVPAEAEALGCLNSLDHGVGGNQGHMAPWERYYVFMSVAMEVWRSGLTGSAAGSNWSTFLNYMNNYWTLLTSNDNGLYYTGCYDVTYSPNAQGLSTAYQTAHEALMATYNEGYNGGLAEPYPSSGLYDGESDFYNNFPWNVTSYVTIGRAALTMVHKAQPNNALVKEALRKLNKEMVAGTGIGKHTGCLQWYGTYDGVTENYQTYAIF